MKSPGKTALGVLLAIGGAFLIADGWTLAGVAAVLFGGCFVTIGLYLG